MTGDTYDIVKWKKDYPFLEDIWKLYVEFDKSVDEDKIKGAYNALCDVVRRGEGIAEGMHKDFCMKLVRNLGPFANNPKYDRPNSERCQILNHWVYYMTKKSNIPDNFTSKIFYKSNEIIYEINKNRTCLYYSYKEKLKEPSNIIKIFNLQNTVNDLVSILMKDNHENNCSCRKFISECIKVYKDMNREYCSGENKEESSNHITCSQLSTFSNFYESFIRTNSYLISKLPTLSDSNMNDIISCESEKSREGLTNNISEDLKPDSPIQIGTNAVLGTMAGVSSLFALSCKFTPLGKWFRPRNLRGTIESSNIGKQAEYELFHNGPEDENIRLDQTRYNVAYSPV
ncbi:VIR protein [Plasmodium vivax]|uniref:VIR protein n=1 Tax=Plasmodium vivax TaxID=5855 RepID=A0A1G4EBR6_PLAVI|nr:VIR protein [Plasmodium vivax]